MKIGGDWLADQGVQQVLEVLERGGHQALLVGGCVRNALFGLPVSDIDIATDAPPQRVAALASAQGLKVVPTGEDHGTMTVIAAGAPHEITTFRNDISTDGRRAVVGFSTDIAEDAARRDFTMNALYADKTGRVLDPLGGLPDLLARRVRFVGDAETRIREDYLRILRFFRFHASYGDPAGGLDADGLAACAAGVDGIAQLSRERIGHEMRRLLAAADPAPSVAAMQAAGVLAVVLPGADSRALAPLVHLEAEVPADWLRRLAALGGSDPAQALRLSRQEARDLVALAEGVGSAEPPAALAYRHGAALARDIVLLQAALSGVALPPGWEAAIMRGATAVFPVGAADLMPGLAGPALGARLDDLESRWIASGFELSREQLLA